MHERTTQPLSANHARAYYSATIADFGASTDDAVLGALTRASTFSIETTQRDAWREQVKLMRSVLNDCSGGGLIAMEFAVPRMGKRIDVLLLLRGVVFVLEFKVGAREFHADAIRQVWDYALDLKNFHSTSHDLPIVPVLVATEATATRATMTITSDHDGVVRPLCACARTVRCVLDRVAAAVPGRSCDPQAWMAGRYTPTPTIIEAARALYSGHDVAAISRHEAEAVNLTHTTQTIETVIREAREQHHKAICFVTGVPGAGKTLVGLNIATAHHDQKSELYSVFLSGNGPLVKVLCEALARDRVKSTADTPERRTLGQARSEVKAFVQNVHHFRDECLRSGDVPPVEHVALFDEAQRAWTLEHTAAFMARKRGQPNFAMSEPAFLISCMDRHPDWSVVVCLVGGGQEINTGEAGIGEWLRALVSHFPHWHVHVSDTLKDAEYATGEAMSLLKDRARVHHHEHLHLSVSMRSFRAEHVSGWVKAVLDQDRDAARRAWTACDERFPIVLSRDLTKAKAWLRERTRGSERCGLLVSSQAQRLRPHAIDVRVPVDPVHWFLHPPTDVRSSLYLEDAATEFAVQGLEVDWACVVWDADLRTSRGGWEHWSFKGSRWQRIRSEQRQTYLKNAYRVLLTRARQGMVIVVPPGDQTDPTRSSTYYDPTYEYLKGLGVRELD